MKLRFLTPNDTPLACTDPHLLDAIRTELLQRPGVVEAEDVEEADALIVHEPWAFREWRYIDRLVADPVVGRHAHKVYTVNSDDAAAGLLRGVYTCLRRSRFDPKLHAAVPFFAQPNEQVATEAGTPRPPASLLATWRGNPKSNRPLRQAVLDLCSGSPLFRAESTESWLNHGDDEKTRYVALLRSGKFSLCPGGWAPASIRIFESMALGVAPVLIADDFVEPNGPDWATVSLRVPEAELPSLQARLEARAHEYLAIGERAYQAWHQHFRHDRLMRYYADALVTLIQGNAKGGSAAAEFARWRSPQMARLNGWTLPQRIANKVNRVLEKIGR
jgi:hypothetical protein